MDKAADLKKQLDVRWKQIDKFEASVKNLAETKQAWRKKVNTKEAELEALKVRILVKFSVRSLKLHVHLDYELGSPLTIIVTQASWDFRSDGTEISPFTCRQR